MEQIIGKVSKNVKTWSSHKDMGNMAFVSNIEPKTINDSLKNEYWILAIQEKLN